MAAEPTELLPGQVLRLDLTHEQAECLASVARAEVFWSVSVVKPSSIAEIAAGLDRPPNTTTYHVNELVKAGLLIAVGERMSKTRREKLYVKAARSIFHLGSNAPKEYRQLFVKGFASLTRTMVREMELVDEVFDEQPDMGDFRMIRRFTFRISRERSAEFKKRISETLREFALKEDEEGVRLSTVFFMAPTVGESRAILKRQGKRKLESVEPESE